MSDYVRTIALTGLAGAVVAGLFAIPAFLPAAIANEEPARTLLSSKMELFPQPFDTTTLAKYDVVFDATVSTKVLSTQTIKKIGYGRVSNVTIVKTPSGTYSSDAIVSPYVQYPGVEVSKKPIMKTLEELGLSGFDAVYAGSFVVLLAHGDV
ncbi:MAG: hypothetical protein ABL879_16255 [Devosia sp.]